MSQAHIGAKWIQIHNSMVLLKNKNTFTQNFRSYKAQVFKTIFSKQKLQIVLSKSDLLWPAWIPLSIPMTGSSAINNRSQEPKVEDSASPGFTFIQFLSPACLDLIFIFDIEVENFLSMYYIQLHSHTQTTSELQDLDAVWLKMKHFDGKIRLRMS